MISESDLIMVALAFLIGYIDDVTGPQPYHYGEEIVIVDKKYQCPTYCGVNHSHSVYFKNETIGMFVDKEKLGKKYKEPKKNRRK
tara:strand:- start:239 stop:493 length:255 start_codon:yes stop_codon:yes gene_type:complete